MDHTKYRNSLERVIGRSLDSISRDDDRKSSDPTEADKRLSNSNYRDTFARLGLIKASSAEQTTRSAQAAQTDRPANTNSVRNQAEANESEDTRINDAIRRSKLNSAWQEAASRGEVNTPVTPIPIPKFGESKYVAQSAILKPVQNAATVMANKKKASGEEAEERRIAERASVDKRLSNQTVQNAMQNPLDIPATPVSPRNYTNEQMKQAGIEKPDARVSNYISNDELLKEYGITPEEFTAAKQKYGANETVLPGITRPYTPDEKKAENTAAVRKLNSEIEQLQNEVVKLSSGSMNSPVSSEKAKHIASEITAKKEQIESLRNEKYNGLDTIAETEKKEADAKKSNASVGTKVAASAVYVPASVGMGTDSALKNIITGGKTTLGDAFTDGAYSKGYKAIEDYFANTGESAASYINRALTSGAYRTNDPYGQLAQDISNMTGVRKDVVVNYIATGESSRMYDALGKDVPEWFKNSVGKQAYMIGQQLPGILLTAGAATGEEAISAFAESFSKAASVSLIGASVYGDTVNRNAKEHGYSGSNYLNAALQGAIEMWTEYMFGFTDAKSYLDFFEPTGDMGQSVWKGMLKYLADGGEEGLEELVNEPLSELADRLTGISNNTNIVGKGGVFDFEQMIASGVDGAIGGLIMGGVGVLASLRSASAKSMSIRDQFNQAEDIANQLPNSYKPKNRPSGYAGMTQEMVDAYEAEVLEGYMRYLEDSSSGDFGDFENYDAGKSNIRQKNIASVKNLLGADDPTSLLTVTKFAKNISDTTPGSDAVNTAIDFIKNELHERIYSDQDTRTLRDVASVLRNQRKTINSELATTAVSSINNEAKAEPVAKEAQSVSQDITVSASAETSESVAAENVEKNASETQTVSAPEQDTVKIARPASSLNDYLEDNGVDTSMTAAQKAKKLAYNNDSIFRTVIDLDEIAYKDSDSADAIKELKHELALINASTVAKTVERYNSVLSKNGITVKVATEEQTQARDHGWYDANTKTIYISPYMSNTAAIGATVVHEYTHRGADADMSLANDILKVRDSAVAKGLYDARISDEVDSAYAEDVRDMSDEQKKAYLDEEKAAHFLEHIMNNDKALREFVSEDRSLVRRVTDAIADFVDRVFGRADSADARQAQRVVKKLRGIVEETAQEVDTAPNMAEETAETAENASEPATESPVESATEPAAESAAETLETAEPTAEKHDIRALVKGTGNAENAAVKLMDEYSGNADAAIADVLASDLKQNAKTQLVNAIAAEASNRQVGVSPDTALEQDKAAAVRKSKELDFSIGLQDVKELQSIGNVSINQLDSNGIQKSRKWAEKFYREMGEKSPFFRAWYGDWREFDVNTTIVVEIPNISVGDVTLEYGDYHIADTGWDVHAGNDLHGDTRHHSGGKRVSYKSLVKIEEILENSILLDSIVSIPEKKKSPNTAFLHKLYTPVRYNGEIYLAKTTVEEFYNEATNGISRRAYNLKSIKIEPTGGLLGEANTNSPTEPMSGVDSNMSIADLFALVKANDKDFHYNPANRNMLNANGTPKVVYHGTTADFTAFEKGDIGYHVGSRTQAEDRISDVGGGHVMELYANIKNPLEIGVDYGDWHGKYAASMMLETEQFEGYDNESEITRRLEEIVEMDEAEADKALPKLLKELGYDGIVYENTFEGDSYSGDNYSYIVFDSNQLKSAADNIGTFDASNPDIRYSRELLSPEERAVRDAEDRAKRLEERNEYLRKQLTLTHTASGAAKVISPAKRRDIASSIATDIPGITIADADAQIKTVYDILEQPKRGAKDTADVRYKEASEAAQKAAEWLVDNAYETQLNPMYDENRELRDFLRTTPIHLNESTSEWGDKESYQQWRAGNKGVLRITPQTEIGGARVRGIDSVYSEAASRFPEYFDADETDMHKMILRLGEVAEMLRDNAKNEKVTVNPLADVRDGMAKQIANRIMWEYADKAELTKAAKQAYAQQMNEQDVRQARAEAQAGVVAAIDTAYQEGEATGKKAQSAADDAYVLANEQRIALFEQTMKRDLEASRKQMQKEVDRANRKAQQIADKLVAKNSNQEIALNAKRFLTLTKRLYSRLTNPNKNVHVDNELQAAVADALKSVSDVKFADGSKMDGYQLEKIAKTATRGEGEDAAIRFIVDSYVDNLADAERSYHALEAEILDTERYNKLTDDAKRQLKRKRDAALSTYYRTAGDMMALISDYVRKADEIFIDGKKQTAKDFADQLIADLEMRNKVDDDPEIRKRYDHAKMLRAMIESRQAEIKQTSDPAKKREIQADIEDIEIGIKDTLDDIADLRAKNGLVKTELQNLRATARSMHYDSCSASMFFQMMGESGVAMDKLIREAQNKQAKLEQKYVKAIRNVTKGKYSTYDASGYSNQRIMVDMPGDLESEYRRIDISKAQIMNLYELWKRPAARRHLEQNGACFTTSDNRQKQERTFLLSEGLMNKLTSFLSEEDIKVAGAIQEFLAADCAEAGNEASMEMYNFRLFEDPNYFPIDVTDSVKIKNAPGFGADSRTFNQENSGFTKRINPNASGAIVIGNIFDVADKHVKRMAAYAAYAPVTNQLRSVIKNENVQKAVEERMGHEAVVYLNDFFDMLSNPLATKPGKDGKLYSAFEKAGNAAKRAAVIWNLSTAMKQPLSIFRAMPEIDMKYILKASGTSGLNVAGWIRGEKGNGEYARVLKTMTENSGIAKMKMNGYSDTGFSKEMRSLYDDDYTNGNGALAQNKVTRNLLVKGYNKWSDAGAWLTGKGDEATWVQLWKACELETADKYADLSDEEQLKKTTSHFNEIIGRTQVVDSILDNAPVKNSLAQNKGSAWGVFMNEPIKTFGSLMTALDEARNAPKGEASKKAARHLAGAIGAAVFTNLFAEPLIGTLMSLFRNERDDTDDLGKQVANRMLGIDVTENGDGTSVISVLGSEVISNIVSLSNPAIGEMWQMILDAIEGYSNGDMASEAITGVVTAAINLSGEKAKYKTRARKWTDFLDALSVIAGTGTKNLFREARALCWNALSLSNNYWLQWEYLGLSYDLGENTARQMKGYYDVMSNAYKAGDTEAYKMMRDDLNRVLSDKGAKIKASTITEAIEKNGGEIKPGSAMWWIDLQARWGIDNNFPNNDAEKVITKVYDDLEKKSDKKSVLYSFPDKFKKEDSEDEDVIYEMTSNDYLDFVDYSAKTARNAVIALSRTPAWNNLDADNQAKALNKAYDYAKRSGRAKWAYENGVDYEINIKWMAKAYSDGYTSDQIASAILDSLKDK